MKKFGYYKYLYTLHVLNKNSVQKIKPQKKYAYEMFVKQHDDIVNKTVNSAKGD